MPSEPNDHGDLGGLTKHVRGERRGAWVFSGILVIAAAIIAMVGFSVGGGQSADSAPPSPAPADATAGTWGETLDQAVALINARKLDDAEAVLLPLLDEAPKDPRVPFNLGVIESSRNRLPQARKLYGEALRRNPRYALALYNLAIVDEAEGKFGAAAARYQKALAIQPDFTGAAWNLGLLLYWRGNREQARELLRQAIKADPTLAAKLPANIVLG